MSEQQAPIHIHQIVDEAIEQGQQIDELVGLLVERGLEPHAAEKVILSRIQIRADAESRQPRSNRASNNEPLFIPRYAVNPIVRCLTTPHASRQGLSPFKLITCIPA